MATRTATSLRTLRDVAAVMMIAMTVGCEATTGSGPGVASTTGLRQSSLHEPAGTQGTSNSKASQPEKHRTAEKTGRGRR